MKTPLYAVLAVLISGCSTFGGGDTQARLDAMEQQMAVVIERMGTIEESNEEVMGKVEELARDTSTNRRLALMEEKQAGMEKMQLELVSYQESLKGSMAKVGEYIEALKKRMGELESEQKAAATEDRRKRLEERLRAREEEEEEARIQEIPRQSIIKIERPTARLKEEEPLAEPEEKKEQKASGTAKKEIVPKPPRKEPEPAPPREKEEPRGGFILEDF